MVGRDRIGRHAASPALCAALGRVLYWQAGARISWRCSRRCSKQQMRRLPARVSADAPERGLRPVICPAHSSRHGRDRSAPSRSMIRVCERRHRSRLPRRFARRATSTACERRSRQDCAPPPPRICRLPRFGSARSCCTRCNSSDRDGPDAARVRTLLHAPSVIRCQCSCGDGSRPRAAPDAIGTAVRPSPSMPGWTRSVSRYRAAVEGRSEGGPACLRRRLRSPRRRIRRDPGRAGRPGHRDRRKAMARPIGCRPAGPGQRPLRRPGPCPRAAGAAEPVKCGGVSIGALACRLPMDPARRLSPGPDAAIRRDGDRDSPPRRARTTVTEPPPARVGRPARRERRRRHDSRSGASRLAGAVPRSDRGRERKRQRARRPRIHKLSRAPHAAILRHQLRRAQR